MVVVEDCFLNAFVIPGYLTIRGKKFRRHIYDQAWFISSNVGQPRGGNNRKSECTTSKLKMVFIGNKMGQNHLKMVWTFAKKM